MTQPLRSPGIGMAATLVLYVVGASTFNILPLLAEGAVHTLGFSGGQVGVMSSTISMGGWVSALLAGLWVRSVPWPRAAVLALGGMLTSNVLALLVHLYWAFVLAQALAGFFGGSILALAATIISDRNQSVRYFGIGGAMQVVYQIAALLAGPTLLRWAGLDGVLGMLAGVTGLTMFLAPLLPMHGRATVAKHVSKGLLKVPALIALVGMGIYFVNAGAYWTYIELMGQARGMTAHAVAGCVALTVSAGILGGLLAWLIGDRFGRLWPLNLAALLTVTAAFLLNGSLSVTAFVVSGLLYFFAWSYSVAYQYAIIGLVDITGRGVAIAGAFGFLGQAAGAALAGFLVAPPDYSTVNWLVVVATCVSSILLTLSSLVRARTRCTGVDREFD